MKCTAFLLVFLLVMTCCGSLTLFRRPKKRDLLQLMGQDMNELLQLSGSPKCYPILLIDGAKSHEIEVFTAKWGVAVFMAAEANSTQLIHVITRVRQLRMESWCITVVVVSNDLKFLDSFAKWSLKNRLLVWSTRLLLATYLPILTVKKLLGSHWTFTMTNTVLMNYDSITGCSVYTHLPYTPEGARMVQLTTCKKLNEHPFKFLGNIFPEKYTNFHGATINVTALPYAPYWMTSGEGTDARHSGMDYNQLMALARAFNFSISVLPSRNWDEVTDQVESRRSFIASVVYVVLPNRLERWDYTIGFDFSPFSFAMAKPSRRPQWQNFYHPLSALTWVSILGSLVAVCLTLLMVTGTDMWRNRYGRLNGGSVVLETVGTLLGQGLFGRVSTRHSNHIMMASWLFFGVVVGNAYRSSLIASLTIPKYPPRPETLEELVKDVERITMASYGVYYKNFFSSSDSKVFSTLGSLMDLGTNIVDGLTDALTMKRAHVGDRQFLELTVAKYFTGIDGISSIYIGRGIIVSSITAWPVPHDAPYKDQLDRGIMAITEGGLYEQWRKEMLEDTVRETRKRKREQQRSTIEQGNEATVVPEKESETVRPLTVTHIQGPLIILLTGLFSGTTSFLAEKISASLSFTRNKDITHKYS